MALSGIAIYKLLPQTNCKECGHPTCLAFAMKLAARQAELAACPYVSDEAKAQLDNASAPPVRLISLGSDEHKLEVGNETVVFRHEKTFVHQPGLFLRLPADMADSDFEAKLEQMADYKIERVGQTLRPDGVAIESRGLSRGFCGPGQKAAEKGLALVLMTSDPAVMEAGLAAAGPARPLVYGADAGNWEKMAALAKTHSVPLAVRVPDGDLGALAELTDQITKAGRRRPGARSRRPDLGRLARRAHAPTARGHQEELPGAWLPRDHLHRRRRGGPRGRGHARLPVHRQVRGLHRARPASSLPPSTRC